MTNQITTFQQIIIDRTKRDKRMLGHGRSGKNCGKSHGRPIVGNNPKMKNPVKLIKNYVNGHIYYCLSHK